MDNYFNVLNQINVGDKIEQKNNLNYLSWAWAWAEVKKIHPDAKYTIYENIDGYFYHTDGKTCWVKTGVTINEIEHIEYLPVMDFRNKSITVESVTSFDVNKAIQRSLTKAVARHGLGLYIYAGEDLPEGCDNFPLEKNLQKNSASAGNPISNKGKDMSEEVLLKIYESGISKYNINVAELKKFCKTDKLTAELIEKAIEAKRKNHSGPSHVNNL